jgi:hypothetical protein
VLAVPLCLRAFLFLEAGGLQTIHLGALEIFLKGKGSFYRLDLK